MHILDQQNFFDTRRQHIGRSDLMPNVSLSRKSDGAKLTNDFDASSQDDIYVLSYEDRKTGERKTQDIKIVPTQK